MAKFLDLPIEILPLILIFIVRPGHLASIAQVNKTWNTFATPQLYEQISIFSWHRDSKSKVLLLFRTLAAHPHLAKHVRRLEIRDFPKATLNLSASFGEGSNVHDIVRAGLLNCVGLRSCVWTRDGSLSSDILEALTVIPSLRSLEFNGHSQGQYDPKLLEHFQSLEKIVMIMPSSPVIQHFRGLVGGKAGEKMNSLTIICKSSPVVNDDILESIAPFLTNIEHFYITGCPKVTERGVSAIASSTTLGLRSLGLESVSQNFDMAKFAEFCTRTECLASLLSITLAVSAQTLVTSSTHTSTPAHTNAHIGEEWTHSVLDLLSLSRHLEKFHVYAAATTSQTSAISSFIFSNLNTIYMGSKNLENMDASQGSASRSLGISLAEFWRDLVCAHGDTLKRFSVLKMPIGLDSVREVCVGCPQLEELFVMMDAGSLKRLPDILRLAPKLWAVHVNFPVRSSNVSPDELDSLSNDEGAGDGSDDEAQGVGPVLSPSKALAVVRRCGPSLTQFGCNTKVWRVGWEVTKSDQGGLSESEMVLLPYESPDIPEPFLVVRT